MLCSARGGSGRLGWLMIGGAVQPGQARPRSWRAVALALSTGVCDKNPGPGALSCPAEKFFDVRGRAGGAANARRARGPRVARQPRRFPPSSVLRPSSRTDAAQPRPGRDVSVVREGAPRGVSAFAPPPARAPTQRAAGGTCATAAGLLVRDGRRTCR